MANTPILSPGERISVASTVGAVLLAVGLATASAHYGWTLALVASVGALGGLAHEVAQSGGKIWWFQKHADGLYIGSLAGMVLGAVAGVLVVKGHLGELSTVSTVELTYDAFVSGLALKGVVEAAGGNPVPAPASITGSPTAAALSPAQRTTLLNQLQGRKPATPEH
jgi:hypothetical protein